jgi:hypothetical protein
MDSPFFVTSVNPLSEFISEIPLPSTESPEDFIFSEHQNGSRNLWEEIQNSHELGTDIRTLIQEADIQLYVY